MYEKAKSIKKSNKLNQEPKTKTPRTTEHIRTKNKIRNLNRIPRQLELVGHQPRRPPALEVVEVGLEVVDPVAELVERAVLPTNSLKLRHLVLRGRP